ncbi:Dynein heavy chain 1, axonemal [Frankliniella fusca]|uniref:Dynein heavy chain 1, axonemal n=1 Tax=Frankliniella fusca TaxID=407009 RepID=A0AAE1H9L4_9NEOP|nr:Dynein heavy chain 1, axonemal [Frankliniella fusca]
MTFLDKNSERPRFVAPKRGFYSEAVSNNPLIQEDVEVSQGALAATPKRAKLAWQVRTELYAPVIARVAAAPPKQRRKPAKDLWVATEDRWGNVIPAELWGPALPTAEEVRAQAVPRSLSIERHMRQYANVSVRDLLRDVPAELLDPPPAPPPGAPRPGLYDATPPFLPLHVFDDEDYDCRFVPRASCLYQRRSTLLKIPCPMPPDTKEWLSLGEVGGEQRPVPVEAYVPESSQAGPGPGAQGGLRYRWVDAGAVAFDPERRLWTVVDAAKREHLLPRLYVRFRAEDPVLFSQRIKEAAQMREECEVAIRFDLFVDCMPVEDLPDLEQNSLERILRSGVRQGALRPLDEHSVKRVEHEIRLSYKRAMCAMMLEAEVERRPDVFDFLALPPRPPPSQVSERGLVAMVAEGLGVDMAARRAHAYWENLFAIPEAYHGLSLVVQECDRVPEDYPLFTTSFGKNVTLDEFAAQQKKTMDNAIKNLQDHWLNRVADNIRLYLRDVGKGWYNLKEKQWDIYLISKMYRLLRVTRLRMECALYRLVTRSIGMLLSIVETPCQCCRDAEEGMVWGLDLVRSAYRPAGAPVFHLYLKMEAAGPVLTTRPEQFKDTLIELFDTGVRASHSIKPVDPLLMTNLVYPAHLRLSSVGLLDPWVEEQRNRLQDALRRAAVPLAAYCDEYHRFLDFYNMNVSEFVSRYESEGHTAAEFKEEVATRIKLRDNILRTVPASIAIGPFLVNVELTRTTLVNKSQELIQQLLQMYARCLRAQLDGVLDEYNEIMRKLIGKPISIEQIVEIKEFMESAPYIIKAQEEVTRRLLFEYEVLDHFWFSLSDSDFNAKWEAVGWPLKLSRTMENASEYLAEETQKFLTLHLGDEAAHREQIEFLTERVVHLQGESNFDKVHELAIEIGRIWKLMKEAQEQGVLLNRRQKLFDLPVTPYEDINRLVKEFQPYRDLWITASEWVQAHEIWVDNPLANVDGDAVERIISDAYKTMTKLTRTFAELPRVLRVAVDVKDAIDEFRPNVPLLLALRNPGLRQRHFDQLREETGVNIKAAPHLTFKMCLEAGVQPHMERVVVIAETAGKEYSIEKALDTIEKEWENVTMDVQPYKNTGTYIMKVTDEELQMLDDQILAVQQMSFSPYVGVFEKLVAEWEEKLRLISAVLEEWIQLQIQWMYLEPIFCSEDIARQLPAETKKYAAMERFWRRIMKTASDYPKPIAICPDKRLLEQLKENRAVLEQVLKGLSDYLEGKRVAFPRFYFLSDDELLEILAQNRNPLAVQPHLRKCFENISKLHFQEADLQITTMFSAEGESVELIPPMFPKGNVETWLSKVEQTMQSTVQETLGLALADMAGRPRADWVLRWPGQIVIAGCQTAWTAGVEEAIRESSLPAFQKTMHEHMDTYRGLVRGQLSRMERQVMSALIVVELHARDVLDGLVVNKVPSANDFDWISQLRYYWVQEEESTLKVRAVNAEFQYGYEYLGNSGRLVITPLTDRCYLTLTGALHLHFGGAPAGPAGTGKTETTKDLAKAMAIQCVVFNCSDQLDVQAMGKFFKGIASAGAWACFDEFNRIDIEVLSVVAQQVVSIQKAQAARMQRFQFEGVEIALKPSAAVFITMNPGYAGRTELPDNLKALFRPVAMMVPNYTLIAEISLFSFGFSDARELANKITTTFKLSSEQLSSQDHYDFGMRAVKTVIAVAGNLKREKPEMGEPQIVLRAIRDVNVPKFLGDDLKLFNGIVSDLFPRLQEEAIDYGVLVDAIRSVCAQRGLQPVEDFVLKVLQLYDTTVVRHGLMLVGPTGSGKTKGANVSTCQQQLRRQDASDARRRAFCFERTSSQALMFQAMSI